MEAVWDVFLLFIIVEGNPGGVEGVSYSGFQKFNFYTPWN